MANSGATTVYCLACDQLQERRIEERRETYTVRSEPISVDAEVAVCAQCGEAVDSELDDANLRRAYGVYRQRFGIIQPDEIRALRERYGLSQRAFARLLGWGEITVHRYETGALPDFAHNDLLILLQDPATMRRFVERHRERLSPRELVRVQAALEPASFIREWVAQQRLARALEAQGEGLSGNRPFDLERFAQMVVFFTRPGRVVRTKLLKLLFYSDFLAYRRLSLSMSGATYVHLNHGPVPDEYETLLEEIERQGLIESQEDLLDFGGEDDPQVVTRYMAVARFDDSMFTSAERAVLQTVQTLCGGMSARQLSQRTHEEAAWWKTAPKQRIDYEHAAELSLT